MAEKKRTEYQIKHDKSLILEFLLRGKYTHQQITDKINERYLKQNLDISLTRQQITLDINKIYSEIEQEQNKPKNGLRAIQLLRASFIASEAFDLFKKTKNFKCLGIMLQAQDMINKLNGLYIREKELNDETDEEEEIEVIEPEIPSNGRD